MRFVSAAAIWFCLANFSFGQNSADSAQRFRAELAAKISSAGKAGAIAGADGWFFLTSELHFLAQQKFWGDEAAKVARATKSPDPLPAIVDFSRQLSARGIELVLVPIPPKAAIYPEKITGDPSATTADTTQPLQKFYGALREQGVNVLDLAPAFAKNKNDVRGPLYLLTDSHFSGNGCVIAAQAITENLRAKIPAPEKRKEVSVDWKEIPIAGDLVSMLSREIARPLAEKIAIRTITDKSTGAELIADPNSPLLLMGDSHTLVFHEFLAQRAGLLDQLTNELGFVPDLIGTRGSGATAVRLSLFRRVKKDPDYLAKKKMVVWCFAAREFTESDQGWMVEPIEK